MQGRCGELKQRFEKRMTVAVAVAVALAEGSQQGPLAFSRSVSRGMPAGRMGTVMMTRVRDVLKRIRRSR